VENVDGVARPGSGRDGIINEKHASNHFVRCGLRCGHLLCMTPAIHGRVISDRSLRGLFFASGRAAESAAASSGEIGGNLVVWSETNEPRSLDEPPVANKSLR